MVNLLEKIREKQAKLERFNEEEIEMQGVNLEVLDISYNDIEFNEDIFVKLKDAIFHSSLRELKIDHNSIGVGGAKYFGFALSTPSKLQTLNLSHCEITAPGAQAILDGIKRNLTL
jgi:Ran GTPase-activating protein (RanGAP) involved in mRNA processing and transport